MSIEQEAKRGRFLTENGGWLRSEGRTYLTLRMPDDADLSCKAFRESALDTCIEAGAEAQTQVQPTYSVFIREASGQGTTYVTSVKAASIEAAKAEALDECAEAWGGESEPWDRDDLTVLGVIEGDVRILEWDDCE